MVVLCWGRIRKEASRLWLASRSNPAVEYQYSVSNSNKEAASEELAVEERCEERSEIWIRDVNLVTAQPNAPGCQSRAVTAQAR